GNYVLLAETVWQATGGGLDLMARPGVAAPATFGARIQIIGGVAPAFADCSITAHPDPTTMYYIARRYGLGLAEHEHLPAQGTTGAMPEVLSFGLVEYEKLPLEHTTDNLPEALIFGFPNSASMGETVAGAEIGPMTRTWFADAGVLIARPGEGSDAVLGVAMKGGHNAEHHNHNDVGSYVVVVEDRPVLLDPGSEIYTARTFSAQRYESRLLNSFGHPVPVVAGQLQRTGREAAAEVLASEFRDERDTLTLDLRAAYEVEGLQRLERSFVYDRAGAGSLTVTDTVEFAQPRSFETPLITNGDFMRREDGTLVVWDTDRAVQVTVDTGGTPWELAVDEIHEEAVAQPTRLAIRLSDAVKAAVVTVRIKPLDLAADGGNNLPLNGDFELRSFGWRVPEGSQGEVSNEMAHSGEWSLKITDDSQSVGSNVTSARMAVAGARRFVLRGQIHMVSGSGVRMYVRYYDPDGRRLNETDERGWISATGVASGPVGEWTAFEMPFETPPGTASMDLWIHSASSALARAYLDDLEIVPVR
ncbi:MAG: heparinase II/III family protein, partial [Armatimonadota bacterium]